MRYTIALFAFLVIASVLSPAEAKKLHPERNQLASVRLGRNDVVTDAAGGKDGDHSLLCGTQQRRSLQTDPC